MKQQLIEKAKSMGIKAHAGWKESTIREKIAEASERSTPVVIKKEKKVVMSPSPLEMAMAMMLESQVKTQQTLEQINQGIQKMNSVQEKNVSNDSQVLNTIEQDVVYEFLVQPRESGASPTGEPIYALYGSTFKTEDAARKYGDDKFKSIGYRIVPKAYRVGRG